jgi:ribosomal protein S18 acetylase RimI-like enzyme
MAYINKAKTAAILCHLSYGKKANIWDDLYFIFKVSGIKLVLQILKREKLLKDLHPKTKFCHLWFIGVKNELQGQGHGSQMLDAIKSICLGKQLPIYLETSNKDNINFYLNNGFVLEKTVQLPMDDFEIYLFSWQVSK